MILFKSRFARLNISYYILDTLDSKPSSSNFEIKSNIFFIITSKL
jgi:hypothetical protein